MRMTTNYVRDATPACRGRLVLGYGAFGLRPPGRECGSSPPGFGRSNPYSRIFRYSVFDEIPRIFAALP
jgi:hypothetical protein